MKKLTLFGRDIEFFWGERKASTKPIEIWPFFLVVTFFLFFTISDAYDSSKSTMRIPVLTPTAQATDYKEHALANHNLFVTGDGTGTLVWHPQSIWQALILKMTSTDNLNFMDIFHIGLLYLFVLIFYLMTRQGKGTLTFSKKVSNGFRYIFFLLAITGPLEYEKYKLLNSYVQYITNGQFRLPEETIHWYYFYLGIMLIVLSRFTDRAAELQKETELTI
ncbi:hypothetical protein [uncultured Mucilaginibacter sp.]|uniref:hypothetical protein n=1 Tax=uncultured Mucilaginibacter sp. TaxID=797541 RepID=UPI0025F810F3|nr:hypothetical protein [uncultured Mucilaginibacter sp.]